MKVKIKTINIDSDKNLNEKESIFNVTDQDL